MQRWPIAGGPPFGIRSGLALTLVAGFSCAPREVPAAHSTPRIEPAARSETRPPPLPPPIRVSVQEEDALDRAVERALAQGATPGAVVLLGRSDGTIFRRAYGQRAIDPAREPMSEDTIFDLASLTKAVATTTAVMWLLEHGRIELDAPASRYLPELGGGARERITVRHLLTHRAGLPPVDALRGYEDGRESAIARILRTPLEARPGTRVRYSDLGFVILGALVERVSGQRLDRFVQEHVFAPLAMRDTGYVPPRDLLPRIAPTERAERRGGILIRGVVHDPRAYRLGGVAGHAGLFSTADDLSRFARMLLRGGELDGSRILAPETVRRMTTREPSEERALGWDMGHPYLSARAFGHGGFTGTSLWIDPERDLFVVVLSNRVHPDGHGNVQPLIREIGRIAVDGLDATPPARDAQVQNGIDVLRRDGFSLLSGARIALLTHDAARARDGVRTLDVLARAPNLTLVRVLSPEHGLSARAEGRVRDARDGRTGLAVHSLFAGRERRPSAAMLEGVDTLVIDLVDVGVRFYTYASSVRRAMEAAHERGLRVVILDRPNPLGGGPSGPTSEAALASFVNHHPLPTTHGMTLGELALLLDAERNIGSHPHVVPVEGWRREMPFSETALRWVAPSPNLPTPESALLYPALGLVEGTNVSVGRGTDAPFALLGAPWLDPDALVRALGPIEGVRIEPARFTPRSAMYRGIACRGLRFSLTDPARFHPVRTGLAIAVALRRVHADIWDADAMLPLLGNRAVHRALLRGADVSTLEQLAEPDLARFAERRRAYLRY